MTVPIQPPETATRPLVSDPIFGGRHGRPLSGYPRDLDRFGYVEEEFFLGGWATRFRAADRREPASRDWRGGKWQVEPAGTAPYVTRPARIPR